MILDESRRVAKAGRELGVAESRPSRPAYHPEEGASDRSDWASLLKAAAIILLPIALVSLLLTH
ncbi:hypothetical protein ACFOD4_06330 [Pseudoroseomonas globiformis]|uniref:Cobalamin biosynthesis protein CobD n=1 Tax=Teichococcus globiformis TaxID=2307229 RepID=A0ABV7G1V1_9PROT